MTVDRRASKQLCQKCSLLGIQSILQLFQLNDDEAILMCKNVDCTFMSSPQWENLVVTRNTSRLNPGICSKKLTLPRKAHSVSGISPSVPTSTRQTHSFSSNTSVSGHQRSSVESFRSSSPLEDSSKFEEHKQTLVPIAPFVFGQAHTFSSFATKKVDKEQLYSPHSVLGESFEKEIFTSRDKPVTVKYRRPSSVESDSLSSGSLDSRPTSPSTTQITHSSAGKKVRKVVVAPDILAKILDGSLQVKFVSSSKSKVKQVQNCYPVSHSSSILKSNSVSISSDKSAKTDIHNDQSHQFSAQNIEKQPSLSHIQAINSLVDSKGVDSLDLVHFLPLSQNSTGSFDCEDYQQEDQSGSSVFSGNPLKESEGCMDFDTSLFDF